jgi:hypothetical protein
MFVLGSLVFGLEALLLGLGGQLSVLYRCGRGRALGLALAIGLAIVGLSILTTSIASSRVTGLEPLYLCLMVFLYTILASRIVSRLKVRLIKPSPLPPPPVAAVEIERMLQKRGFGEPVDEEKKRP